MKEYVSSLAAIKHSNMSLNAGFQLSLELTKAFPIRSVAESVGSKILAYARNARKSGSDIVVEADLAEVFGRGRIEYDIEQKFRKLVKIQGFSFLRDSCEVSLDSGVGPTILNALQDVRHFSTIIQLSFLGWTHEKTSLAAAIDQGMVKRFEMGVEGASASPGYEGILHTLEACSSQSSAFAWSDYTNLVDAKLRDSIPKYQYSTDLIRLSPAALTGAMDYLYLVQQLPESRKIMISNAMGSITFVVWAHYILGLNVIITTEASPAITFGDEQNPHILITWSELTPETHFLLPPATKDCGQMQPSIQLLDEDMSVMLESSPDPDHWTSIRADTRYPLRGYGSICLHRLFNANCITNDHDPIYKESVKLIVAIAIWVSKRVNRDMGIEKGIEYQSPQRTVAVEIWRILASAEVIFSGITWATDTTDIVDRVEYLSKSPLDAADLPKTCSQFFKKIPIKPLQQSPASCYIFHLRCLASMVFLFGFVAEIQSCSDVPLRELRLAEVGFEHQFLKACKNIEERLHLEHDTIFIQISLYLSDTVDLRNTLLHSEFGWSVYLDTFGDRDPAQIRPELVHIQKGVPTNRRTMERKSSIKDGSMELGPMRSSADDRSPPIRGREYIPRSSANAS